MAPTHWTAPGVLRGVNHQLASKSSPRIRPPRSSPTKERSHVWIYIYLPRLMEVKSSVKHPHYSECSVCPPIYIHAPPTI